MCSLTVGQFWTAIVGKKKEKKFKQNTEKVAMPKKRRKIHVLDKKMGYVTYYNRIKKELE